MLIPNADGFDVSNCKNVTISDCNIIGGDEEIAISPCADGFCRRDAENILVTNCTIKSRFRCDAYWFEHLRHSQLHFRKPHNSFEPGHLYQCQEKRNHRKHSFLQHYHVYPSTYRMVGKCGTHTYF